MTYRGWGAGVCDRGGEADYERILSQNRQFLYEGICFLSLELSLQS